MCSAEVLIALWAVTDAGLAASEHTAAVVVVGNAFPVPCPRASVVLFPPVSAVHAPQSAGEETPLLHIETQIIKKRYGMGIIKFLKSTISTKQ